MVIFSKRVLLVMLIARIINCLEYGDVRAFLTYQEQQVTRVAQQATKNHEAACNLLSNCKCSRAECVPPQNEIASLTCVGVPNSSHICPTARLLVSLQRSIIRLPPGTGTPIESYMDNVICSQSQLDPVFRDIMNVTTNMDNSFKLESWVFFGSATGIQRIFPAKETEAGKCYKFDLRKRPWYINAIAVVKNVHVLLDRSESMEEPVGFYDSTSCFKAAQIAIKELIDTLSFGDYVNISQFGPSTTAIGSAVVDSTPPQEQKNLQNLQNLVDQATTTFQGSNLTEALYYYYQNLQVDEHLKVLIILTGGKDVELDELESMVKRIDLQNVIAFVYRMGFDTANDGKLRSLATLLGGVFNQIQNGDNTLWKMHSYYSYLARLRYNKLNGKPLWTTNFTDHNNLGDVVTVSMPAFDSRNELIGVAGIDILTEDLVQFGERLNEEINKSSFTPTTVSADDMRKIKPVLTGK